MEFCRSAKEWRTSTDRKNMHGDQSTLQREFNSSSVLVTKAQSQVQSVVSTEYLDSL